MSEVSERYRSIANGFTTRLEAVPDERWSASSPCPDWTARDVAAHVIGTHRRVLATLDGTEPAEVDLGGDLPRQWRAASDEILEALSDETRASTLVSGMFSEQPFEALVGRLVCADTLIHTWDLARATGQDERLDPVAVAKAMEFLGPIDDAIRRPGGFGPKIVPAPGADEQTTLLNFSGRAV